MQVQKEVDKIQTPFRPMYSAIWPLDIAPIIAPTFDREPNNENCANHLSYYKKWYVDNHNHVQTDKWPVRLSA